MCYKVSVSSKKMANEKNGSKKIAKLRNLFSNIHLQTHTYNFLIRTEISCPTFASGAKKYPPTP